MQQSEAHGRAARVGSTGSEDRERICPFRDVRDRLRSVGLRLTRQRFALGWLIFGRGDRHFTAEALHEEALAAKLPVSLATVYNTVKLFAEVGLIRHVNPSRGRAFFDNRMTDHHHFVVEGEEPIDIAVGDLKLSKLPEPPEGLEIWRVDVAVRLRRIAPRVEKHGRAPSDRCR